jgi:hypothetical protein
MQSDSAPPKLAVRHRRLLLYNPHSAAHFHHIQLFTNRQTTIIPDSTHTRDGLDKEHRI